MEKNCGTIWGICEKNRLFQSCLSPRDAEKRCSMNAMTMYYGPEVLYFQYHEF